MCCACLPAFCSILPQKPPLRLSLLLDGDIAALCRGPIGATGAAGSTRPRSGWGGRRDARRAIAQDGGHLTLHECPGGAVYRCVQRAAPTAGAVDFAITPLTLDVHSGAREAEPVRMYKHIKLRCNTLRSL